jgi:ATP-dependent Clp protease ATP-binding subunit ClpA
MKKVLPKVKRIINMSLKQAKFYGDNEVRIEHIIISLINDYNNNAIKTLVKMGVDVDKLHKQIERTLTIEKDDFQDVKINSKEMPLDNVAENILKGAEKECDNLNNEYLDTQHIILSLLKIKSVPLNQWIMMMKISLENQNLKVVTKIMKPLF